MKIKRFQAPDVRQALKEVRDVLGPDAVILSNTRVDGGVEIVAATDYDESSFRQSTPKQQEVKEAPRVEIHPDAQMPAAETLQQNTAPENIWSQEPTLIQMRKEIAGLRDMLQNQLSDLTWKDMEKQSPTQMQILKRFLNMGVQSELARQLILPIANIDDLETAWNQVLGHLANRIPLAEQDMLTEGGIYAFVGPTGVGKTTTIAKLAARFALKHGAREVALITTDSYRIGGQEQLRSYARILGVPVRVARSHEELADSLSELSDRRLVLIDTAGMNQRDMNLVEKFNLLKQQSFNIKVCLTMSATTQAIDMEKIITTYSQLGINECIITKMDESSSIGSAISTLIRHNLPLSYTTNGQQVPEDLSQARPNVLIAEASQQMNSEQIDPYTLSGYGGFAAYG